MDSGVESAKVSIESGLRDLADAVRTHGDHGHCVPSSGPDGVCCNDRRQESCRAYLCAAGSDHHHVERGSLGLEADEFSMEAWTASAAARCEQPVPLCDGGRGHGTWISWLVAPPWTEDVLPSLVLDLDAIVRYCGHSVHRLLRHADSVDFEDEG